MDENKFKQLNKFPVCTRSPFEFLIPYKERQETLLKIKNESIDKYGEDLSTECTKRLVCLGDCLGRPLPNVPTAQPFLKELQKTQIIKNNELFISGCNNCPILKNCTKSCPTINDYINRNNTREPKIIYQNSYIDKYDHNIDEDNISLTKILNELAIPWDALSAKKIEIVKMYIYQERDFKYIANNFKLNNEAEAKYIFYSSLNKLSEFGIMRKFFEDNENDLTETQKNAIRLVYYDNLSLDNVAKILGTSKQAISNLLSRIITTYNIKWHKFVTKKNGQPVYQVLEIIK